MFSNTSNTRDLCDINSKLVKPNLLLRSDRLDKLNDEEISKLKEMGIRRVVDFRSEYEKGLDPNVKMDFVEYIEIPIQADSNIRKELSMIINGELNKDVNQFLIDANRDFVYKFSNIFSGFLKMLLDGKPTLFHCSAGKDRTGFAALLIHKILNIDEDLIIEDYMNSNKFIENSRFNVNYQKEKTAQALNVPIDKVYLLEPLLKVDLVYINAAIDEIKKKYKSIDEYITLELGITDEEKSTLRNWMLY